MSTFSRYIFSQNEGGKGERSRAVRRISKKSSNFVTVGFALFINQLASLKATPGCTNAYFHCRPLRTIFRLSQHLFSSFSPSQPFILILILISSPFHRIWLNTYLFHPYSHTENPFISLFQHHLNLQQIGIFLSHKSEFWRIISSSWETCTTSGKLPMLKSSGEAWQLSMGKCLLGPYLIYLYIPIYSW